MSTKQIMPKGGFTRPAVGSTISTHSHVGSHAAGSKTAAGANEGDHKAFMTNDPNVHYHQPSHSTTGEKYHQDKHSGMAGSKTAAGNEPEDYCA